MLGPITSIPPLPLFPCLLFLLPYFTPCITSPSAFLSVFTFCIRLSCRPSRSHPFSTLSSVLLPPTSFPPCFFSFLAFFSFQSLDQIDLQALKETIAAGGPEGAYMSPLRGHYRDDKEGNKLSEVAEEETNSGYNESESGIYDVSRREFQRRNLLRSFSSRQQMTASHFPLVFYASSLSFSSCPSSFIQVVPRVLALLCGALLLHHPVG